MRYKNGDKVWYQDDDEIKEHVVQDTKYVTWIQKVLVNNKWMAADDVYPSLKAALEADERNTFRMFR